MTSPGRRRGSPRVNVFANRDQLGQAAAGGIAHALRTVLDRQDRARVVFAAAPSQRETLAALATEVGVDWGRVAAFHLDEYVGLPPDHPAGFGAWLRRHLFDSVPFGSVSLMPTDGVIHRYAALLTEAPIDVVCCGIGVNGHLAFNDPPAQFADPEIVKVVELHVASRRQQVDDGCFATLDDVPRRAVTMTVPAILSAGEIFCVVPGAQKRNAVQAALSGEVSEEVPASALQLHPNCSVYLDVDSAPEGWGAASEHADRG